MKKTDALDENKKREIIEINDIEDLRTFRIIICNKLKLAGEHFDKLSFENKVLEYQSKNKDKEVVIEINKNQILKRFKNKLWYILMPKTDYPPNYEVGNPLNRWIHNDPIVMTEEESIAHEKKVEQQAKKEFQKIWTFARMLNSKFDIKVVEIGKIEK